MLCYLRLDEELPPAIEALNVDVIHDLILFMDTREVPADYPQRIQAVDTIFKICDDLISEAVEKNQLDEENLTILMFRRFFLVQNSLQILVFLFEIRKFS